jgi:pyruvate dehydrogenase E1 component alpha subunit
MEIARDQILAIHRTMVTIRMFEDRTKDLYATGSIPGLTHLYIGEEAVAAGVCAHLREDDYITSTHRGHGHVIAKGGELKYMMAELFGKKTGYCKGKGGSMHIADVHKGILGANGIAGGGMPIAGGAALSSKIRQTDQVTVCFFGDGASNTGAFHESLNFAAVLSLPVIFCCENNLYAITTHQRYSQKNRDISIRASAYGMPGITVDGNDVLAVYRAAGKAIGQARKGKGPTLIECKTYRWRGHQEGDANQGVGRYRTKEELQEWVKKCPIKRLEEKLIKDNILDQTGIEKVWEKVGKEIDEAVEFAKQSPLPDLNDIFEDVYVS